MNAASGTGLRSVLHPVVITGDLPRALVFYRDLLGLVVEDEMIHDPGLLARLGGPPGANAQAVILRAPDGSELEIASFAAPVGRPRTDAGWPDAGIRSITFVIDDIATMLRRMATAGYERVGEIVPFEVDGAPVLVAYIHGPDGVILTLLQRGGSA
jgi:catechol 2,3-dioxygenase-like lactoylglutathione lyase family enzyme